MAAFDDVVARAEPTTKRVTVVLSDHGAAIDQLEAEMVAAAIQDARENKPDRAPKIAAQIVALEEAADRQTFTLRSIGAPAWSALIGEHPPTDDQRASGYVYNPDTFPYAAVAASIVDPEGATAESVTALAGRLSGGRWANLWQACREINASGDERPKSLAAFGVMAATEKRSQRRSGSASRTPSSSAGSGRTPKTRANRSGSPRTASPRSRSSSAKR